MLVLACDVASSALHVDQLAIKTTRKMEILPIIFGVFLIARNCIAEFSTEDCSALGFSKANLLCSSCDTLQDFGLQDLKDHCWQCCHKDESKDFIKRYHSARLEVCTCKFGAYPQIQAFIKSERPSQFRNLQIRYVRGLDPVIKLMDKEGNVQEVLAIEKWDTDTVEEFLKTHLEPDEGEEENIISNNTF